jgi:acetyl-CoA carboxylase biotin carboxyl carrier protein
MKLMNEIESDVDGAGAEIYAQNAQAVEFGEPLFAIRTS